MIVFSLCTISLWIFSTIRELIFSILIIMFVGSVIGVLVCTFSISKEHILVSLLIFMICRSVIR
jgi:hypothetical protein